jgi:hypothetical protein
LQQSVASLWLSMTRKAVLFLNFTIMGVVERNQPLTCHAEEGSTWLFNFNE